MAADTGFGLPVDYQSELDALQRRRALAQALMQQGLQGGQQGTQAIGGVAIRNSPLGSLLPALQTFLGNQRDQSTSQQLSGLQQRAFTEGQQELGMLQGMADPQARIAAAMASRFPGIRSLGLGWQKENDARVQAGAKAFSDYGQPNTAVDILRSGSLPSGAIPAPPTDVKFGQVPGTGNPGSGIPPTQYALTTNRKGEVSLHFPPVAPSQTVTVSGDKGAQDFYTKQLEARQTDAKAALGTMRSISRAADAISRGATVGGGAEAVQGLRKVADAFGVRLPETGTTDELRMALGQGVLAEVAKLRPASDKDIEFLGKIVGSINTDPSALSRALSYGYAIAAKGVQDFQRYAKEQTAPGMSEEARRTFQGATTGYEPPDMPLPENFMVEAMRTLQQLGGDPNSLYGNNPNAARFQLGGLAGNPTIQPMTAVPPPNAPALPPGMTVVPRRKRG